MKNGNIEKEDACTLRETVKCDEDTFSYRELARLNTMIGIA